MLISFSHLKSLSVYTQSETYLGKVSDVIIDIETHAVRQYEVSSGRVTRKKYLISREQILEITDKKIVVADAAITELAASGTNQKLVHHPTPALTSEL